MAEPVGGGERGVPWIRAKAQRKNEQKDQYTNSPKRHLHVTYLYSPLPIPCPTQASTRLPTLHLPSGPTPRRSGVPT